MSNLNEAPITNLEEIKREIENYKYVILNTSDLITLVKSVNELIEIGWKPLGGMALASDWDRYYQTMIKDE